MSLVKPTESPYLIYIALLVCILDQSSIKATDTSSIITYMNPPDNVFTEEIPVGIMVLDINEYLKNRQSKAGEASVSDIEDDSQYFAFIDEASVENLYYSLDPYTGQILTKRYLNRESLCTNGHCANDCKPEHRASGKYGNGDCRMNIKVLAIPSYTTIEIDVIIQRDKTTRPAFESEHLIVNVSENAPIGHRILLSPMSNLESIQNYSFTIKTDEQEERMFDLRFEPHAYEKLYLLAHVNLDREIAKQYNLMIEVCDGNSTEEQCGHLNVTIDVLDQNDNKPRFNQSLYTFFVNENAPIGTIIGQVSASDIDEGKNAKLTYQIIETVFSPDYIRQEKNETSKSWFWIDPDKGLVVVNSSIDFEHEKFFTLGVRVTDAGSSPLSDCATIQVIINDINDVPPKIDVRYLNVDNQTNQNETVITLRENIQPDTIFALITISDEDTSTLIDWKVYVAACEQQNVLVDKNDSSSQDFIKLSQLSDNSFLITTGLKSNTLFDRETCSRINISIKGIDSDFNSTNFSWFNFSIILEDENDNAPQFDSLSYELNIIEDNEPDELVYEFRAVDLDINENGEFFFSLEDIGQPISPYLQIEPLSGRLLARKSFNYSEQNIFEFYVVAKDLPKDVKSQKLTKAKCLLRVGMRIGNFTNIEHRDEQPISPLFLRWSIIFSILFIVAFVSLVLWLAFLRSNLCICHQKKHKEKNFSLLTKPINNVDDIDPEVNDIGKQNENQKPTETIESNTNVPSSNIKPVVKDHVLDQPNNQDHHGILKLDSSKDESYLHNLAEEKRAESFSLKSMERSYRSQRLASYFGDRSASRECVSTIVTRSPLNDNMALKFSRTVVYDQADNESVKYPTIRIQLVARNQPDIVSYGSSLSYESYELPSTEFK